jgi:hypothetical protein
VRLIDHLRNRESARIAKNKTSRFAKGDLKKLAEIKLRARFLTAKYTVYIVQPGLSANAAQLRHLNLLASTELYLQELAEISLKVIASP